MPTPTQPAAEVFDAPVLLVEARYRARPLCAHVLFRTSARRFVIGHGRRADAPVDPSYLPSYLPRGLPANDNHTLVERRGAGFVINLSPAMRARAERTATHLRIPCGEVVFDISAVAPPPQVPRAWLRPGWRAEARITSAVALALLLLLALVRAVPSDPHALSLDDVGRAIRLDGFRIVPPVSSELARAADRFGAGGAAPAASAGPSGAAGHRRARVADARRATSAGAPAQDARFVHRDTLLAVLEGAPGRELAEILSREAPALGAGEEDVLAHTQGVVEASAFGTGGLGPRGTGAGAADTGRPLLGGAARLGTVGWGRDRTGAHRGYGERAGDLGRRQPRALELISEPAIVRGSLDKELVRRVVRRHLNEIRYCYEQALARRPALAGRVVARFTIAPNGRVVASALESSALGEPSVEGCIVAATRRWEFPQPKGGGLVLVSYPFQLAPAGAGG